MKVVRIGLVSTVPVFVIQESRDFSAGKFSNLYGNISD